jgi:hypothetical protein
MKTIRLLFFLSSVFAISAVFFACGGGTTPDAPNVSPSIYVTQPTVTVGPVDWYTDITFSVTCNYNTTTKKALKNLKLVVKYTPGSTQTLVDTTIDPKYSNSYPFQYLYTVSPTAPLNQVISFTLTVTDADSKTGTKVFTYTVNDLSDILDYNINMGAQSNATYGSYYAGDSNKVYKSTYAKTAQGQPRIDFVYLYDAVGGYGDCIAAPNNSIVSDQDVDLCGSFSTKNATTFKQLPPMTDSAYNKIRSKLAISQLFNTGSGAPIGAIKTLIDDAGGSMNATFLYLKL